MNTEEQDYLARVRRAIKDIALTYVGDDDDKAALIATEIMIAAAMVGPHVKTIVTLLCCPTSTVEEIAVRLRASRLWTEDSVNYQDWHSNELGDSGFQFDLLVALGLAVRTTEMRDGYPVYRAAIFEGQQ